MIYIKNIKKEIIICSIYLITLGTFWGGWKIYISARATVVGQSMQPTLNNSDSLLLEKVSLFTGNINRGQIITFDSRDVKHDIYIKRVIAIEGDEVEISNGKVYLNGKQLSEPYLKKDTITNAGTFLLENIKLKIKKGSVFVLGDHREASDDSRYFGPVSLKSINGHVILRIYPLNEVRDF